MPGGPPPGFPSGRAAVAGLGVAVGKFLVLLRQFLSGFLRRPDGPRLPFFRAAAFLGFREFEAALQTVGALCSRAAGLEVFGGLMAVGCLRP
jgi:hypothetical protein